LLARQKPKTRNKSLMFARIFHSLSARLLLLFICAGAVLILIVGSIVGKGFAGHFRNSIEPFMVHYVELMERQLGTPPDQARAKQITSNIPVSIHVFGKQQSWSTNAIPPDIESLSRLFSPPQGGRIDHGKYQLRTRGEQFVLYTRSGDYDVYYQVYQPTELRRGGTFGLSLLLAIVGILVLIFYATKALFRPIEDIQTGVQLIGSGRLDHRISKRSNDQLGDLADNVNAMADDISDMLEAKRQLLLGISHELRSPITRSRVNLALMEESKSKTEVERDIASMEQMITELLESERLNSRHVSLNLETVRLDHLIRDQVQREFFRKVQVMDLVELETRLDQARIKLLLRNLLQNAIKHSVDPNRKPRISLVNEADQFCIYVTDSGDGIDPAHIPHLTEPFYRADPSRQRKTGGYGLGLHLCKVIVEAHGGELSITSEAGLGTTIRCIFPAIT